MNKITDEYLLEKGYKKYPPSPLDNKSVVARFQKRFDDNFGKKYFVDILRWSNDYIPMSCRSEDFEIYSYEYEIYFSMCQEERDLKVKFFNNWSIEDVEIFAEDFFEKMHPNYYEDWDDNRRVRP